MAAIFVLTPRRQPNKIDICKMTHMKDTSLLTHPMLNIQILFTNYHIITDFLNLSFCSEHFISIKYRILATFYINNKFNFNSLCASNCNFFVITNCKLSLTVIFQKHKLDVYDSNYLPCIYNIGTKI
jgi:hypothetical protein